MNNSNIYTVHLDKDNLDTIFNNVKNNSSNLLYTNCIGKLEIGNDYFLAKQFDMCFYSPENDIIVLIERASSKSHSDIRKYLTTKNINFNEVRFINLEDNYQEQTNIPNISFAREKQILENLIRDSKDKGFDSCTFYPQVDSKLLINYQENKNITLEQTHLKGLIIFPDKYIFMTNEFNPKNLSMNTVAGILINENLNVSIIQEKFPQKLLKEEKGSKVLCKKM